MATEAKFDPSRQNPFVSNLSVQISIDQRNMILIQSQHIKECFFVEDIFSHCIIGKLVFIDVESLFEAGPFTGNEIISLIYGVEETREIVFDIWKVTNIIQASPTHSTDEALIELIFVDTTFYNMFVTKNSFSFAAETPYTDMVKYMLINMVGWSSGDINLEPCSNFFTDSIALPYWTTSESIDFLLKRAKSKTTNKSGYLVYNSTEDQWKVNVKTMDYLFSKANVLDKDSYIFEDSNANIQGQNKIYEWWIEGINKNTMDAARGGIWKGFNPKEKKFLTNTYTYKDGINDLTAVGSKSLYSDISDANSFHRIVAENTPEDLQNVTYDTWVKNYNIQQQVNIILPGNEKRFCGMQIEVEWPSMQRHEFTNKGVSFQKQMRGKYLIQSITHNFVGLSTGSNINYTQRIKLLKNAFHESDAATLLNIPSKNQNMGGGTNKKEVVLLKQ